MLSRAANLPRICLACRLGNLQRTATRPIRFPTTENGVQLRSASGSSPQSKERIEALISGALDDLESGQKGGNVRKRRGSRRGKGGKGRLRGGLHDEPAEWELEPEQDLELNLSRNDSSASGEEPVASAADFTIPEIEVNRETSTELRPKSKPESQPESQPRIRTRPLRDDFVYRKGLGLEALGLPVDALVIKNPNRLRRVKKPIPENHAEDAISEINAGEPLTWQSLVPQETGEDEPGFSAEVRQNIEEIRPKDTTIIKRKDFDKLVEYLVDGFTHEQLVTYFNLGNWDSILDTAPEHAYSWIVKQSPWTAAVSNNWAALKLKQRQAVAILTAMWKLEVQEQVEGLGRTVVWLNPQIFRLISNSRLLDQLRADYLDGSNNERMSSRIEECRLSVYARKSTVAAILSRLDEIVQTVKSDTLAVHQVKPENLQVSILEELERKTKTALFYRAATSTLAVSWLAETDMSNGQTEGPADIVLRLLIGRDCSSQNAGVQILPRTKSRGGAFLTHQRDKRSMSWRDKLQQWSRYVNAVGKPKEKRTIWPDLTTNINITQPKSTSTDEQLEITATFGHILHTNKTARAANLDKSRRVLAPVIPHPAALTGITAETAAPSTQKTAIILNFVPETSSTTSLPDTLPQIRLRLPIGPFTDLSHFSFPDTSVLEAVIPWQESDILLPAESVDVRLTQKRLVPLDAKQTPLQEFLQASDFNLLQGRLRTPSRTTFAIPKFCSTDQDYSSTETVSHPYMFMGLEIHQTVDTEWQSHTLRYSSIEAGQHGGQQQILSLIAGPPSSQGSVPKEGQLQSFLTLVEETACGQHFSWDEGYKLMQERSVEQFTWDMMDTEYAESSPDTSEGGNDISLESSNKESEGGSLHRLVEGDEDDAVEKLVGGGEAPASSQNSDDSVKSTNK